MNHQYAAEKMMQCSVSSSNGLVCPKPRRVSRFNTNLYDPGLPLQWHVSQQQEACDAKAANELLDIILAKGGDGDGVEQPAAATAAQLASSPPFFSGSPPSRVSNPVIQDARFGHEVVPLSPRALSIPSGLGSSPSPSARMGGCVRANFANNPVVRVEGFDCFNRDRRVGSIPALA
ncbi:hypothetical protein LIER_10753 [Lithospermum erythrorhizon]|uniref:Uncharacterized protein n=1 Tax=Lithospermum erythrorhizon TaxID=34254 RepID=A0AAV3PLS1_LITER